MYVVTVNQKAARDEHGNVLTFETNDEVNEYIESEVWPKWDRTTTCPRVTVEFADRWVDPVDPAEA